MSRRDCTAVKEDSSGENKNFKTVTLKKRRRSRKKWEESTLKEMWENHFGPAVKMQQRVLERDGEVWRPAIIFAYGTSSTAFAKATLTE